MELGQFFPALLCQGVILPSGAQGRVPEPGLDEPPLFQPQKEGVHRPLGDGAEAVGLQGLDDFIPIGLPLAEDGQDAALEQGSAQPWDFWWKLLLTAITLGAGLKGGEIFPSFAIGACFGCVVGPLLGLPGPYAAGIGMVSLFCGVTNCPLAALALGWEVFSFCNPQGFLMAVAVSFLASGYSGLYAKQKFAFSKSASPEGLAHTDRQEGGRPR